MQDVPYGFCHCGCGRKTTLAPCSNAAQGYVKGEPRRFIHGHQPPRRVPWYLIGENGCWVWQGGKDSHGYGVRTIKGRAIGAHRWMYEKHVGPIPTGLEIDHLCRVRSCVNPAHMEVVTRTENQRRSTGAKLTLQEASYVRELRRAGWLLKDLAEAYGISESRVSQIGRGHGWN